jgi:hypothetical protein
VSWLLDAYRDKRTYGSLAYQLLGLPIGIFGFIVVVTGFSLGLGLMVTLAGIPVLVATLLFVRAQAALERRLAWSLLEAPMPRRTTTSDSDRGYFWRRLRELVSARRSWREVGFVISRLPLGIIGFTVAIAIISLMFGGFAHPIVFAVGVESQIGSWRIDTFVESLIYLPFSLVFLLVGPRILLGWGTVSGRIATAFLGHVDPSELKLAVAETLARTGETDAFAIINEVELRLGHGPYLTATQIEATLLALESSGQVQAHRLGSRTLYALRGRAQTKI